MNISERYFGSFEGKPVMEYCLDNNKGMQVAIINYGATITKIIVPDRNNNFENVVNNYSDLDGYLQKDNPYKGCIVGRYCNRIANAAFVMDGVKYKLEKNHGNHSLHGGVKGFDKAWWDVHIDEKGNGISLTYLSKDGEEGFPGNLQLEVVYALTDENELKIHYSATTDKSTPVNFTNHCYFNLTGNNSLPILNHELKLFAETYTITDKELIPTGEIGSVENTALDFGSAKKIGMDIDSIGGYDHNMIINKKNNDNNALAETAELYEPISGRSMKMFTTEPAVQFYSGNQKPGGQYGLCLEAQHYPNSPNEASFPDTILKPGDVYNQTTIYSFSVK